MTYAQAINHPLITCYNLSAITDHYGTNNNHSLDRYKSS